ncbi:hypothetical protein DEO72_LG6g1404 [Vigna unguiculata]|uniref:Uncharacterized protein n=1 Tax=Vigna unguiculata TaxID=3917 RepID=A0A4D6M9A2_VIGUN|nr:hypothetical protein DEO72_LG6g1404 [Vigna unguiculata]
MTTTHQSRQPPQICHRQPPATIIFALAPFTNLHDLHHLHRAVHHGSALGTCSTATGTNLLHHRVKPPSLQPCLKTKALAQRNNYLAQRHHRSSFHFAPETAPAGNAKQPSPPFSRTCRKHEPSAPEPRPPWKQPQASVPPYTLVPHHDAPPRATTRHNDPPLPAATMTTTHQSRQPPQICHRQPPATIIFALAPFTNLHDLHHLHRAVHHGSALGTCSTATGTNLLHHRVKPPSLQPCLKTKALAQRNNYLAQRHHRSSFHFAPETAPAGNAKQPSPPFSRTCRKHEPSAPEPRPPWKQPQASVPPYTLVPHHDAPPRATT